MYDEANRKEKSIVARIVFVLGKFHISSPSIVEKVLTFYRKLQSTDTALSVSALAYATWQCLAMENIYKDPRTVAIYYNVSTKQMLRKAKKTNHQSLWHSAADSAIFLGDYVGLPYKFSKLAKDIMEVLELQVGDKTPEVLFAAIVERYLKPIMRDSLTLRDRLRGVILEIDTKDICKKVGVQWRHVFKVAASMPNLHIAKESNRYIVN